MQIEKGKSVLKRCQLSIKSAKQYFLANLSSNFSSELSNAISSLLTRSKKYIPLPRSVAWTNETIELFENLQENELARLSVVLVNLSKELYLIAIDPVQNWRRTAHNVIFPEASEYVANFGNAVRNNFERDAEMPENLTRYRQSIAVDGESENEYEEYAKNERKTVYSEPMARKRRQKDAKPFNLPKPPNHMELDDSDDDSEDGDQSGEKHRTIFRSEPIATSKKQAKETESEDESGESKTDNDELETHKNQKGLYSEPLQRRIKESKSDEESSEDNHTKADTDNDSDEENASKYKRTVFYSEPLQRQIKQSKRDEESSTDDDTKAKKDNNPDEANRKKYKRKVYRSEPLQKTKEWSDDSELDDSDAIVEVDAKQATQQKTVKGSTRKINRSEPLQRWKDESNSDDHKPIPVETAIKTMSKPKSRPVYRSEPFQITEEDSDKEDKTEKKRDIVSAEFKKRAVVRSEPVKDSRKLALRSNKQASVPVKLQVQTDESEDDVKEPVEPTQRRSNIQQVQTRSTLEQQSRNTIVPHLLPSPNDANNVTTVASPQEAKDTGVSKRRQRMSRREELNPQTSNLRVQEDKTPLKKTKKNDGGSEIFEALHSSVNDEKAPVRPNNNTVFNQEAYFHPLPFPPVNENESQSRVSAKDDRVINSQADSDTVLSPPDIDNRNNMQKQSNAGAFAYRDTDEKNPYTKENGDEFIDGFTTLVKECLTVTQVQQMISLQLDANKTEILKNLAKICESDQVVPKSAEESDKKPVHDAVLRALFLGLASNLSLRESIAQKTCIEQGLDFIVYYVQKIVKSQRFNEFRAFIIRKSKGAVTAFFAKCIAVDTPKLTSIALSELVNNNLIVLINWQEELRDRYKKLFYEEAEFRKQQLIQLRQLCDKFGEMLHTTIQFRSSPPVDADNRVDEKQQQLEDEVDNDFGLWENAAMDMESGVKNITDALESYKDKIMEASNVVEASYQIIKEIVTSELVGWSGLKSHLLSLPIRQDTTMEDFIKLFSESMRMEMINSMQNSENLLTRSLVYHGVADLTGSDFVDKLFEFATEVESECGKPTGELYETNDFDPEVKRKPGFFSSSPIRNGRIKAYKRNVKADEIMDSEATLFQSWVNQFAGILFLDHDKSINLIVRCFNEKLSGPFRQAYSQIQHVPLLKNVHPMNLIMSSVTNRRLVQLCAYSYIANESLKNTNRMQKLARTELHFSRVNTMRAFLDKIKRSEVDIKQKGYKINMEDLTDKLHYDSKTKWFDFSVDFAMSW